MTLHAKGRSTPKARRKFYLHMCVKIAFRFQEFHPNVLLIFFPKQEGKKEKQNNRAEGKLAVKES